MLATGPPCSCLEVQIVLERFKYTGLVFDKDNEHLQDPVVLILHPLQGVYFQRRFSPRMEVERICYFHYRISVFLILYLGSTYRTRLLKLIEAV